MNNSARQVYSRVGSRIALQLRSNAFYTTGHLGKRSSISSGAANSCGIALKASNIGTLRPFSTASSKKLRFLIKNKSSFGYPNMRREDGSITNSFYHRSEKRQSTLAACSTITDEASTSPENSSMSVTSTKGDTTKRNRSKASKKEASAEVKEKDAPTKKKKKKTYFTRRKAATKATNEIDTNQENKKADTSKSKKAVDSSKEKKVNNRSKSKTKDSTASSEPAKAEICMKASDDGSGSDRKPLTPLYPATARSVVVVESVTKAKVIQKYLGNMYEVLPSYGHVRDLAGRSRSVRPDDDFSMVWEVPAAAWTHLKSIKVALKGYVF
jgi:hypothetical protein